VSDDTSPGRGHRLAIAITTLAVALAAVAALGVWVARAPRGPATGSAPAGRGATSSAATAGASTRPAQVVTLEIGGMQCDVCVQKVRGQLAKLPGVTAVSVDLATQRAVVTCASPVADTALTAAVRRAGPEYLGLVLSR
jgi:copper chaperone CopZ